MFQWLYFIKLAAPLLKRGPAFYELYKKEIEKIKTINLYFYHFYVHIFNRVIRVTAAKMTRYSH